MELIDARTQPTSGDRDESRTFQSRAFRQAIARPPMRATSWATAMLDTVARPMWLSGMRKAEEIGLSTPIWWRTRVRSGRVAGSTSQITSNGRVVTAWSLLTAGFDEAAAETRPHV